MKTANQSNLEMFGERLVKLSDGREGLRGGMRMEVTKGEGNGPVLDFIASDATLDRYDETIEAAGWKLENYRRNPVFQNSHKYGDVMFTLGRSLMTEVQNGKLYQRIEFAVDINPMAKIAYGLYRGKFLSAVSVGFIPIRWETGSQDAPYRRKYLEQELLELSAVAIPANPNALVMGVKSGAVEEADVREAFELLKQFCSDKAASAINTGTLDAGSYGVQLLQSMRAALAKS